MKAIVAIDKLWGIGNNGNLLFHIKEDMEFFKQITTNKVVVMGRKTFDSLPNRKPLKDRINLVISSKSHERYDNVIFGNMDEINEEIKKYDTNNIYIIGGSSIYKQFIHRCDTIYVTHNTTVYEADSYMPNLAFEGFTAKVMVSNVTNDKTDWFIEKWITSECEPYTSVLWFKDKNNKVVFIHANNLYHWRGVYSNKLYDTSYELKEKLMKVMAGHDKIVSVIKIHDYYRAEINTCEDNEELRIASFGATESNASENLIATIASLLI